jgi:hypothetical protein
MPKKNKISRYKLYGEFYSIPISDASFKVVIMDFIINIPSSVREGHTKIYNTILIIICKFTKFAVYIPTRKNINAAGLINLLLGYIIEIFKYF